LSLGHNNFSRLPHLQCCPNLEELRINGNKIKSIPPEFALNKKIKTLDIANNLIDSWSSIEVLVRLPNLTNLSAKNNPLPPPPPERDDFVLREDIASESISDENELLYRRHVLGLFQVRVGKEQKLKVRLVVLDTRRVKEKWSHYSEVGDRQKHRESDRSEPTPAISSKNGAEVPNKVNKSRDSATSRSVASSAAKGAPQRPDHSSSKEKEGHEKAAKRSKIALDSSSEQNITHKEVPGPHAGVVREPRGGILGDDLSSTTAATAGALSGKKRKLERSAPAIEDKAAIPDAQPEETQSSIAPAKKPTVTDESKLYVVREKKPDSSKSSGTQGEKLSKQSNVSVDDILFKPSTSYQPQGGWD
jgi:hypothetical protein